MSDPESVGEISDPTQSPSSPPPPEDSVPTPESPPSRSTLEREASKLKSKYRILRSHLHEEQIEEIDRKVREMEGQLKEALVEVEERRNGRLTAAYERKRIRVQAILADYESRIQTLKEENNVLERSLLETSDVDSVDCRPTLPGVKAESLQDDISNIQ